ncbi:hypothetical protein TNCV_3542161 [Trichonephila clavipes]|nr:hypothetical protein TNCV_3542161 [Trichonephila clavipes]
MPAFSVPMCHPREGEKIRKLTWQSELVGGKETQSCVCEKDFSNWVGGELLLNDDSGAPDAKRSLSPVRQGVALKLALVQKLSIKIVLDC